jgi:hypothetical protein
MPVDFLEDQAAPASPGIDFLEEPPEAPTTQRPRIVPPGAQFKLTPYQQAAAEGRDTGMWGEGPMAIARGQPGGGGEGIAATASQIGPAFRYAMTIPGRALNAIVREERAAGGQGIEQPAPPAFGESEEEFKTRAHYPLGAPGEQLYVPQTANPSDVQRWAAQASTLDDFLALPLGTTRTGARVLLSAMIPGVLGQLQQIATGPGNAQDKLEQARDLVVPAVIGLMASKPKGARLVGEPTAEPEAPTGRQLAMPEGAPLPPQPPPVPPGPVPPREAFPPGPAPKYPPGQEWAFRSDVPPGPAPQEAVPPREAFPPGPAPTEPVPPREAFPPGPAPTTPVPPRPPVAPVAPAKPEVARLEPDVPGKMRNKLGDPLGTTYHATPEDWAAWQDLQKLPVKERFQKSGELEAIKNKYGGMPPQAPKPPVETGSPHDLVPALKTKEGDVIQGQKGNTHDDVYAAQGDIEGKLLRISEPEHGFWNSKLKKFQSREEAAAYVGEKDPLHSERLIELQKKTAQPEPPAQPAPAPSQPVPETATPVADPIGETVIEGKPLREWEKVIQASDLPKGEARARLAKWLAVPNQPARILQALANKKRTREIHAPPPTPESLQPVAPAAPSAATPATTPPAAPESNLGPTGGAGPGSPSITQGPDPNTIGLSAGSPTLNRIQRAFSNFYHGMGQLFSRGPVKQDLMTLANRANNLPRIVGQKAGNSIRLRARTPQEQEALTFLMQSLKMSGDRLSVEATDRLGELEFEGDPGGYLRIKQADMETLAQRFLQQGKKLEAEAAIKAAKGMEYAQAHFNELRPVAEEFRRKTDLQHRRLAASGVDVQYENWYVPQRHDLDLMSGGDRPIVLGHSQGSGVSTGFKKAKVYEDYASAIEAGFIPRTLNAADLLENYVAQTEKVLMQKSFYDSMRSISDPVDGKSLVIDVPRRVITRPDGSIDVQESVPIGYTLAPVTPGARVAVHNGYIRLIKALTGTSQLAESAVVGTLQDVAAIEKHIGLALDTFHASRTLQGELVLTGKVSLGARQRMGRALVEYSPRDLDAAVSAGELTQEMADWIRTPKEMQVNGRAVALNPQQVVNIGINNGLNIARFADVIYRDWLRETPILKQTTGAVNKWVFDKMSRSAIAHGFSSEFERVAGQHPEWTANQVGKQVARDINVMFGNLQKESFFRNPSLNSIMQVLFLAPRWVESLARREVRGAVQLGTAGARLATGRPANLGTVGKGMGTGLAAYFVGTQILNLITRHQLTFQNKEHGHKLDAWIPDLTGKTPGFFISPLSVFGEITHDILRFADSKPDFASALAQIGANKLGNLGRFLEVVASGRDPLSGDKIIGTGRRAVRAGLQLVPVPITLSQGVRAAGHAVAPGLVQAPPPGALQRQLIASAGFKTEPAGSAQTQVYRMADDWKSHGTPKMQAEVERRLKEDFGPSDYGPLRTALVRDDQAEARRAYQQLRNQGKTPKTIRQTLQHPHPFTGSAAEESKFKASLSPEDRDTYRKAIEERKELYRRFQRMLNTPQQ